MDVYVDHWDEVSTDVHVLMTAWVRAMREKFVHFQPDFHSMHFAVLEYIVNI